MDIKTKALRVITTKGLWENFGELVGIPGWDFILTIPKLSAGQRNLVLALAQGVSSLAEFETQAGLNGKPGLAPGVKVFWRGIAKKLSTGLYSDFYKTELDRLYKANKSRELRKDYESRNQCGELPLTQLKVIARQGVLSEFLKDLLREIKDDM